jgi:hypothetical protein
MVSFRRTLVETVAVVRRTPFENERTFIESDARSNDTAQIMLDRTRRGMEGRWRIRPGHGAGRPAPLKLSVIGKERHGAWKFNTPMMISAKSAPTGC